MLQAGETDQVNTFVKIICTEMLQEKFYRYSMETYMSSYMSCTK